MPAKKVITKLSQDYTMPPATSPEERENQLIALAYDLVEKRLIEGTATSQETVHFLKMGSVRQQEELEKLRSENELLKAKTECIQSDKITEQLYRDAIDAMRSYQPTQEDDINDPYIF